MPNICNFKFKAIGTLADLFELYKAFATNYNEADASFNMHFYRIFDIDISSIEHDPQYNNHVMHAYGECAWSLSTCLFHQEYEKQNKHGGTTIQEFCKKHKILIEFYSEESGMGFSEHYIIERDGIVSLNDTVDYYMLSSDTDLDTFNIATNLNWTQEKLDAYFKTEDYYVVCKHDFEYTI